LRQLNHHHNHVKLFRAVVETLARKHHHSLCVVRALVRRLRSVLAWLDASRMFYVARELKARRRACELACAHLHNDLELAGGNLSKYVVRALVLRLHNELAWLDVHPMFYVAPELKARHRDFELVAGNLNKYVVRALVLRLRNERVWLDVPPMFCVARELARAHLHSDRECRGHQMVFPHPCAVVCRKDSRHLYRERYFLLQRAVILLYCGLLGHAVREIRLWLPWTLA
jgi:hypothetical protein